MVDDPRVRDSQEYLNNTYGGMSGYVAVAETGQTGWPTMFAITRALQIELGVSPTSSNFGTTTQSAFASQFGELSSATTNARVINLLTCALWCKGYYGGEFGQGWQAVLDNSVAFIRDRMGLNPTVATVTTKMMKSLLTMDAYTILLGGSSTIRSGQQWLNGRYINRQNFYISPSDGLFTRQLQEAIVYAIQYELGMTDSVANGNLGPGTKAGIQTSGLVQLGSSDTSKRFVRLFQLALACNGYYNVPQNGTFDNATRDAVLDFQNFMEISNTGKGDWGTWAALLVSTGDPDRPVTGMDTSVPLTTSSAAARYNEGYRVVGRYLTVTGKSIVPGELPAIFGAGLKFFPIFQNYNNAASYFSTATGRDHGRQAAIRARELGIGATPIFFAVDYDATGEEASAIVVDYFQGIKEGLAISRDVRYKVGIYATRNVCTIVANAGLAEAVWVSGMSTGYSGNLGFKMPESWWYNQIKELSSPVLDRNAVAARAQPLTGTKTVPLSSGQFHPLYWGNKTSSPEKFGLMKLQVLAEEQVLKKNLADDRDDVMMIANRFVMFWLEKEAYTSFAFKTYLKSFDDGSFPELAIYNNPALVDARNDFYSAAGSIHQLDSSYPGDLQHCAVTAHGVLNYGTEAGSTVIHMGDLGGWALDLCTLYADWWSAGKPTSINSWITTHVGGSAYTFPMGDLVADVDGWLVGQSMREDTTSFAEAWRRVLLAHPTATARIAAFVRGRFGSSSPDFAMLRCVHDLFTAEPWTATGFSRNTFLGDAPNPLPAELADMEVAFYERLMSLAGLPA